MQRWAYLQAEALVEMVEKVDYSAHLENCTNYPDSAAELVRSVVLPCSAGGPCWRALPVSTKYPVLVRLQLLLCSVAALLVFSEDLLVGFLEVLSMNLPKPPT
jgi:hypothetical protein